MTPTEHDMELAKAAERSIRMHGPHEPWWKDGSMKQTQVIMVILHALVMAAKEKQIKELEPQIPVVPTPG